MARKSVDMQSLLSVDSGKIIEVLSQENAQLKVEKIAQQVTINNLIKAIEDLTTPSPRSPKKTGEPGQDSENGSGDDF